MMKYFVKEFNQWHLLPNNSQRPGKRYQVIHEAPDDAESVKDYDITDSGFSFNQAKKDARISAENLEKQSAQDAQTNDKNENKALKDTLKQGNWDVLSNEEKLDSLRAIVMKLGKQLRE